MFGQISDVISENPDEFRRRKMLQPSVEEIQSQRPSEEDYYKHAGIARKILGAIAPPPYNEEILYGGFNRRMRDYNALFLSVRHFFSLGRFTSYRTQFVPRRAARMFRSHESAMLC